MLLRFLIMYILLYVSIGKVGCTIYQIFNLSLANNIVYIYVCLDYQPLKLKCTEDAFRINKFQPLPSYLQLGME